MENLKDKVAVVTGAGSGIGAGISRALAAEGCHVVVADIDADAAAVIAAELLGRGVESVGVRCDVTDREAVEALADDAWQRFGHVDLVANNAGVIPRMGKAVNIDERDARWVLDVNLMGVLFGCQAFGRRFIAQGTEAHILNTGSENSLGMAHTGAAMYAASKHAVLGLSDVLRNELPEFIGVSILCPGMVRTNLATAVARRPDRYGGPVEGGLAMSNGLEPDEIGRRAVEGVKRGDFYIVTHPPVRELVEERAAEILAAFDAQAPRYDGDEAISTRHFIPPKRAR